MTCVITSGWHPFDNYTSWSPMDTDLSTTDSLDRHPSHGYASSGSESKRPAGGSSKKRASRAGTRSVTTLSAAQLERKRANDREAQRAIRQRTKDHIEILERTVSELRGSNESNEKVVAATRQRNRELEEENAFLRNRLNAAGYAHEVPSTESHRLQETSTIAVHSTSPSAHYPASGSNIQRPNSVSSPGSLSATTASQSSESRHSSFPQVVPFVGSAPAALMPVSQPNSLSTPSALTTWRSHDGIPTVQPPQTAINHSRENGSSQQPPVYHLAGGTDRTNWVPTTQQYQYSSNTDAHRQQHYESHAPPPTPASVMQQQYVQAPPIQYTPGTPAPMQPQQAYHTPQGPPQAEFQSMAVSSPAGYEVQQASSYQQTPQQTPYQRQQQSQAYQHGAPIQMAGVQMSPASGGYSPAAGQMQPPPIPNASFGTLSAERHYATQQLHPPMQYPQDTSNPPYSLTHYPPG